MIYYHCHNGYDEKSFIINIIKYRNNIISMRTVKLSKKKKNCECECLCCSFLF